MIADTSALLAFFNTREPAHAAVAEVLSQVDQPIVVSPFVLAELDYLVTTRFGVDAALASLAELGGGAYDIASFTAADLLSMRTIIEKYRDQTIGLTDASLVLLAQRHQTTSVLTLDRRHFEVLRTQSGEPFEITP